MRHELRLVPTRAQAKASRMTGKVYLIGAGPGDPELMTLRAVRALGEAGVVLVDELVDLRCLVHAKFDAKLLRVGKRGGCKSTPQAFIERLMVRYASRGAVVARLKGGDPFVFGRGGEELLELRLAGIDVEVIPGITAGIGVPAELGIPITLRGVARGATFITGHVAGHDWKALRATGTTLVIYMGLARLGALVAEMLIAGFPATTPACAVQHGTLPKQRAVFAALGALPLAVANAALGSPALIIVGDVVNYGAAPGMAAPLECAKAAKTACKPMA
jgi:uroporphyrin-III C-methyltransferase